MTHIAVVKLTEENRPAMVKLALSMYLGETCPYCKKTFDTLDDLKSSVWNGYTEYGRIAHGDCFFAAHRVTEQVIGGAAFVRVDVPAAACNGIPAFTKFYGASAIYAITPCSEATANAAVEGLCQKPVNIYQLNLPSRSMDIEGEEDSDE